MCFFYYLSVFMFIRGHPEGVTQKGSPRRGHPETKMFDWVWYAGSHAF
jgi:hypothetical protein